MSNKAKAIITASILMACGLAYLAWLNHGCEAVGVMTWRGKVCAEDLIN